MNHRNIIHINWPLTVCIGCFLAAAALLQGCYNDSEEYLYPGSTNPVACDSVDAKFSADILPLISTKCAISGCHDAASASGGVILQNYTQVSGKKDRINERVVIQKTMPPTGPLPPEEISKIKCWIDNGALNN